MKSLITTIQEYLGLSAGKKPSKSNHYIDHIILQKYQPGTQNPISTYCFVVKDLQILHPVIVRSVIITPIAPCTYISVSTLFFLRGKCI